LAFKIRKGLTSLYLKGLKPKGIMDFTYPRPEGRGNRKFHDFKEEYQKYLGRLKQIALEHPEDKTLQETMHDLETERTESSLCTT
jgi:hypothetical protein